MQKSDQIDKIAVALTKAQVEMEKAVKTSTNESFGSKYADLTACLKVVMPALTGNGIAVSQSPGTPMESSRGVVIDTLLMHSSGQWLQGSFFMPCLSFDPHSVGSAITYAKRYALAAMVGLATEDDDANSAMKGKKGDSEHNISHSHADEPSSEKSKGLTIKMVEEICKEVPHRLSKDGESVYVLPKEFKSPVVKKLAAICGLQGTGWEPTIPPELHGLKEGKNGCYVFPLVGHDKLEAAA